MTPWWGKNASGKKCCWIGAGRGLKPLYFWALRRKHLFQNKKTKGLCVLPNFSHLRIGSATGAARKKSGGGGQSEK